MDSFYRPFRDVVDEKFDGLIITGAPIEHRSEEHTSELQSLTNLVCRLLLEKKNNFIQKSKT